MIRPAAAPRHDVIPSVAAILALALGSMVSASGPPVITNEDIVRLVAHGTSEKAVLAAIAEHPVRFDLEPDVVEELRVAGVNDRVLEAMRRRQAAMPREKAPPVVPAPSLPAGRVEILFDAALDPKDPVESSAVAIRKLPKGVTRPGGLEVAEVTDLALAVLCTTPDHVPDHWDTHTQITGGPRSEAILFHPGSRPTRTKGFDLLYLDREGIDSAPLAPGRHTLVVALAGRQAGSGSWRILASDTVRVEASADRPVRITLKTGSHLRGSTMTGYKVEQEWKVVSVDPPESDTRAEGGP